MHDMRTLRGQCPDTLIRPPGDSGLTALHWLKAGLQHTLSQSRERLQAYMVEPASECLQEIHRIHRLSSLLASKREIEHICAAIAGYNRALSDTDLAGGR